MAPLGPALIAIAWSELFDYVGHRSGIQGYALAHLNNALFGLLAIALAAFVVTGRRFAAASRGRPAFTAVATIVSFIVFGLAILGNLAG